MRTSFGSIYAQTIQPTWLLRVGDRKNLLPANPESTFAFGLDARAGLYTIDSKESEDTSSFEIASADLYGQVRFVPERFSFYIDQRVGSGGTFTRELFLLLSFPVTNSYVKVGRFLLPYGWAIPDDDAFIREPMGHAFSTSDIGIEVGIEPGPWSAQLAITNGTDAPRDNDRGKKVSLVTTRTFGRWKVGVSGAANFADAATTQWGGLFGGVNFGRLSLLAEGDQRRVRLKEGASTTTWAAYFEADLLIVRGLNLKYAHDWIDPDRNVDNEQEQRDSLGLEWIPCSFVQLRAFAHQRNGPARAPGARDRGAGFEVHIFF